MMSRTGETTVTYKAQSPCAIDDTATNQKSLVVERAGMPVLGSPRLLRSQQEVSIPTTHEVSIAPH
jgi:hypothetical protein